MAYAKSKGMDVTKLEERITQSAGKREQIVTRSQVRTE